MLEQVHGHRQDRPTLIGESNGDDAIQVYATGLYEGVRKGQVRWVTGTGVQAGLDSGVIVQIAQVEDTDRAQLEADSQHAAAAARDHVVAPEGAMFEQTAPTLAPVPEATDVDRGLADMSKSELVKIAQKVGLPGRSAMDKSELYEHLRHLPEVEQHLP